MNQLSSFFENKENRWEEFGMDKIKTVIEHIHRMLPTMVAGIAIFGSYGDGDNRPGSDLDIAILPSSPLDPVKLWYLAQEIAAMIDTEVDLVDLWKASTVLQHQVVSRGRWISIIDKHACDLFDAVTFSRYGRFNRERREILVQWKKEHLQKEIT